MPTGYTAKLCSEDQSFEDFVMGCAKAFGACISLRDEPAGTPIPEKFEPSPYHADALENATQRQLSLSKLNQEERHKFGKEKRSDAIVQNQIYLDEQTASQGRFIKMKDKVSGWEAPTPGHVELKTFMLQQLNISTIDTDYSRECLAKAKHKGPMEYYRNTLDQAVSDIEYHTKAIEKEQKRNAERNQWVEDLRGSLQ